MSKASEIYTITAAIEQAEKTMKLRNDWKPKNEIQKRFLKNFLKVCRGDKVPEIELEVSPEAEKINSFLEKKGFSIRLQPFPPNTVGFASILDLIVEWLYPGEKVKIDAKKGGKYEGVRIKKEGGNIFFFESTVHGYKHIIAGLQTKSGDTVFITIPKGPLEGLDLIEMVSTLCEDNIGGGRHLHPLAYDGIRFPMVDLDITNDIGWLKGMSTTTKVGDMPADMTQAVQQIKIKMNEKGARFQSATAFSMVLMCVANIPHDLIIDEPFLVWVTRPGLEKPLMAAFVTEENWKNPGNL